MRKYPVGDALTTEEIDRIRQSYYLGLGRFKGRIAIVAVKTDEFREPHKNEWFLSGARPTAYRAFNDLTTSYWICKLTIKKELC